MPYSAPYFVRQYAISGRGARARRSSRLNNAVQRPIFCAQIRYQRPVIERPTRDPFAQVVRTKALAVLVDLLIQPRFQPRELAAAQLILKVTKILARLLHELRGVQVAERIGREIAQAAEAPVHVLQAALVVRRRRQT